MLFRVKVRLDLARMMEFGQKLQSNKLDRSAIRTDTYCLRADPAVGFSIWEATDRSAFDEVFAAWRVYYSEAEITEVITARDAMGELMKQVH
jgi:hypothetical protein